MEKITLSKQNYKDARKLGLVENLNLIGIICSYSDPNWLPSSIEGAMVGLKREAREVGATHVFGIEHLVTKDDHISVFGEAYKK